MPVFGEWFSNAFPAHSYTHTSHITHIAGLSFMGINLLKNAYHILIHHISNLISEHSITLHQSYNFTFIDNNLRSINKFAFVFFFWTSFLFFDFDWGICIWLLVWVFFSKDKKKLFQSLIHDQSVFCTERAINGNNWKMDIIQEIMTLNMVK